MSASGRVIGLLGAECTGKTWLAQALAQACRERGWGVAVVGEVLREFCEQAGRPPRRDEQRAILVEQTRRIAQAAQSNAWVIADTTALMTAAYSHLHFADASLDEEALAAHRRCSHTLLLAPDLPWQADGWLRDGEPARAPVHAWLQRTLDRAGVAWHRVHGQGPARLACALEALGLPAAPRGEGAGPLPRGPGGY